MGIQAFAARLDFARRHVPLALPYITIRKLANLALNEAELFFGFTRVRSQPPFIKLESTPLCHLACPGCPHSDPAFKKALGNKKFLSLHTTVEATRGLEKTLIGTSLSYTGEPMLNPDLIPIIEHLHRARHYTSFPTNLSVPLSEEKAEALVGSGLDLLMVSLDGTSAETYAQFRKRGNFALVKKNVALLAAKKRQMGSKRPYLLWKFIIFDHNKHEVDVARAQYRELGFDGVEFNLDHDGVDYEQVAETPENAVKPCYWAWNTATIGWDGDVQPCCKQMNRLSMGNASTSLKSVWNNEAYNALRASFRDKSGNSLNDVCRSCLFGSKYSVDPMAEA